MAEILKTNDYQTKITDENLKDYPEEVKQNLLDFINNVPLISHLIDPERPRACDLERDDNGRIIVDVTQPHILEDMNYFRPIATLYEKTGQTCPYRPNRNPNSEFYKWAKREYDRCYNGMVRESDGEWIPGDLYFFWNYCPIQVSKKSKEGSKMAVRQLAFPFVMEGQYLRYHYLWQSRQNGKHSMELASRGVGKAILADSTIYTPSGFKKVKDLAVGDYVYNEFGKPVMITDIPFNDVCDFYEIEFKDGRKIKCSSGHLWTVYNDEGKLTTRETLELFDNIKHGSNKKYNIPICKCVDIDYKDVGIDPYIAGMSLFNNMHKIKKIPNKYKLNDRDTRLRFLQGFLNIDKLDNYDICINTSSKQIINDVIWIIRSIGYICNCEYINNQYKISISLSKSISISKISYIGKRHGICISVDNPTGLYLANDFIVTHNSFTAASLLARRFLIGQGFERELQSKVTCYITANDKKYLVGGDQSLDKFQYYIDWNAVHNPMFPRKRITNTLQSMQWRLGYKLNSSPAVHGLLNAVVGISAKDDPGKLRGTRGVLYIIEECGSFGHLLELYNTLRPSVENGEDVFGQIFLIGTSGDSESDFSGALELMQNPLGYNLQELKNVYDKTGQGRQYFVFFYPAYMNRANCFDKNGNSDVVKALLELLYSRYKLKYNSNDPNSIIRETAERPITPEEAIIRTKTNIFPTLEINERIAYLDSHPEEYDDTYVGDLVINGDGDVVFKPSTEEPIRDYPLKSNKFKGALEIFSMPLRDGQGKIPAYRYIISCDPVDQDKADSLSLVSIFVFDRWTDTIAAEYTGRNDIVENNYEMARKLCMFYNATMLYENNITGTFQYFDKMNSLHLLAETPEFLRDIEIVKFTGFGNTAKGVRGTTPVNAYADKLTRSYLMLQDEIKTIDDQGEEHVTTIPRLKKIKNRAFLRELACYNPTGNFDRVRAFGILMIYREEFMIREGGIITEKVDRTKDSSYRFNDKFFKDNYDKRLY